MTIMLNGSDLTVTEVVAAIETMEQARAVVREALNQGRLRELLDGSYLWHPGAARDAPGYAAKSAGFRAVKIRIGRTEPGTSRRPCVPPGPPWARSSSSSPT
jgi:hypothetical protein